MIQVEGIFTGGGVTSAPIMGRDFTWTGGDNTCMVLDDGDGNWRIKFLSSGIFTPLKNMVIDVFLVGGGAPGGNGYKSGSTYRGAGGGGSGYTTTARSVVLAANTAYQITVGAGGAVNTASGGDTTAFGATASGGKAPNAADYRYGGNGASGGGMGNSGGKGSAGGSDGSDGAGNASYAGKGQGTTTREFGETDGDLYAGGGAGGGGGSAGADAATVIAGGAGGGGDSASNTRDATPGEDGKGGGGGGGSSTSSATRTGASGGSGIAIIRNHREEAAA